MTTPFAYVITQVSSNIRYYGIKFAQGCQPTDLGTTYFSSSRIVKKLIKEEGIQNFRFEIRKIFKTRDEAIRWEKRFLTRINAAQSPHWFNKHNGTLNFYRALGYKCSESTKQNMRKPKSKEHRAKLKEHLDKNRKIPEWTENRKEKQSAKMRGTGNHNYGKSDHPGAIKFQIIAKSRKGKTREELYGKEKAEELRIKCKRPKAEKVPCIHCNKYIKGPAYMKKWHGDNCKNKQA
jgi:hypothetical protein